MICFNILSNKGLKLAKFHGLSDTKHSDCAYKWIFIANWKNEIKVEKCCSGQLQVTLFQRQWFPLSSTLSSNKSTRKLLTIR
jgi:hypothetical protein